MTILNVNVKSVADLGLVTRAVRKHSHIRLDDLAGCSQLSKQFVSDVERGKETVRLGLVFQMLDELGIRVTVAIPEAAAPALAALRQKGVRPAKKRQTAASAAAEGSNTAAVGR